MFACAGRFRLHDGRAHDAGLALPDSVRLVTGGVAPVAADRTAVRRERSPLPRVIEAAGR